MRKKYEDDDNSGVSLLTKRLSGEKLDDKVIDDLMKTEEKTKKKDNKNANQQTIQPVFMANDNNQTNTFTSSQVAQSVQTPVREDINKIITPVVDEPARNVEPIAPIIPNATVQPVGTIEATPNKFNQRNTYDVNNVQEMLNVNVPDNANEDQVINNVINNTFSMLAENKQNPNTCNLQTNNTQHLQPNTQQTMQYNVANTAYAPNAYAPMPQAQPVAQVPQTVQPMIPQPVAYQTQPVANISQPVIQPVQHIQPMAQTQQPISQVPVANKSYRRKKKSLASKIGKKLLSLAITLAIIGVFVWVVFTFMLGIIDINGNSMSPTYYDEETLFVDKITINFDSPDRREVVVFTKGDEKYVARIAGVPGDTVSVNTNGDILINGETFTIEEEETKLVSFDSAEKDEVTDETPVTDILAEITLGANEFFVLSDNENEALDSRLDNIGIVTKNDIYGIVLFSFNFNK